MANEKDNLVPLSPSQMDPYRVKGSDFPAPKGMGKAGDMSGQDELVKQSPNQISPRAVEGEGPSVWGTDKVQFKIEQNKGEGGQPSTSLPMDCAVDKVTGQITPNVSTERD